MPVDETVDLTPLSGLIAEHIPLVENDNVVGCTCGFQADGAESWEQHLAQEISTATQPNLYRIVRRYEDGRPDLVIKGGVPLSEAQAHSRSHETSGEGWDDGYEVDP
jgi:hypothetical protein